MTCRSSKDSPTASRRVTTDAWLRVPAGAHGHRRSTGVRLLRAILFSAVRDVFNDLSVLGGSSSTVLKRSPRSQPRSSHLSSRVVPPSQFRAAPSIAIRPCCTGRRSIGKVRCKRCVYADALSVRRRASSTPTHRGRQRSPFVVFQQEIRRRRGMIWGVTHGRNVRQFRRTMSKLPQECPDRDFQCSEVICSNAPAFAARP
jgi:hypothetical protein